MWSRVWSSCAFCVWLAIRSWVVLAKWYWFRDSLWQFCWYRLWQWYWSICTCLSVSWRACRLLACWRYCWSFWSCCFWYRCSAQCYWFRICQNIMICSCLAFQSWSTCFLGLNCVSSYCTAKYSSSRYQSLQKSFTRNYWCTLLNILWMHWWNINCPFKNFKETKISCCCTQPMLTWFD